MLMLSHRLTQAKGFIDRKFRNNKPLLAIVSIKTIKLHDNDNDDDDDNAETMDALLNAVRFVVFVSNKINSNCNEFRSFHFIQLKVLKLSYFCLLLPQTRKWQGKKGEQTRQPNGKNTNYSNVYTN